MERALVSAKWCWLFFLSFCSHCFEYPSEEEKQKADQPITHIQCVCLPLQFLFCFVTEIHWFRDIIFHFYSRWMCTKMWRKKKSFPSMLENEIKKNSEQHMIMSSVNLYYVVFWLYFCFRLLSSCPFYWNKNKIISKQDNNITNQIEREQHRNQSAKKSRFGVCVCVKNSAKHRQRNKKKIKSYSKCMMQKKTTLGQSSNE